MLQDYKCDFDNFIQCFSDAGLLREGNLFGKVKRRCPTVGSSRCEVKGGGG